MVIVPCFTYDITYMEKILKLSFSVYPHLETKSQCSLHADQTSNKTGASCILQSNSDLFILRF